MKRTLYQELLYGTVIGRKFNEADILSIKHSIEYAKCSEMERAFIDQLFKDYSELRPNNDTRINQAAHNII